MNNLSSESVKFKMKKYVNELLEYVPVDEELVKNFYRRIRYEKNRKYYELKQFVSKYDVTDPDNIYWIDPMLIEYHTNYRLNRGVHFKDRVFDMNKDKGQIYDGDWDISPYRFRDLDVYKAFHDRIIHNKQWEETDFYKYELTQIENGRSRWGCYTRKDWDQRCHFLDSLIESIRDNGYRISHQVTSSQGHLKKFLRREMAEEITVNIGRNGEYLFQASRHRLAIAQLVGVERVPVKVLVRHKQWQNLRQQLLALANRRQGGASPSKILYQPVLHPDLSDIPAAHACEDRFLAIKEHLHCTSGHILDLGANLCYFCHKFEGLDFSCYAVEVDPEIAEIAYKIKVAGRKQFPILVGSIIDPNLQHEICKRKYGAVVALNIFHHFIKEKKEFIKLRIFLNNIKMDSIFFAPHRYEEKQMKGAYMNFSELEFIDFILKNTGLSNFEKIHTSLDGRNIYKLY